MLTNFRFFSGIICLLGLAGQVGQDADHEGQLLHLDGAAGLDVVGDVDTRTSGRDPVCVAGSLPYVTSLGRQPAPCS